MNTDSRPLIVIPDIHGHCHRLKKLLLKLRQAGLLANHCLAFLGDYVDRGPEARGTIELMIALVRDGHLALAGNHDVTLAKVLDVNSRDWAFWVDRWARNYESGVLKSYGVTRTASWEENARRLAAVMPPRHRDFLSKLPWFHETDSLVLVHAGLEPKISWEEQREALSARRLTSRGPSQLFSHSLATTAEHPAAPKRLVTGHWPVIEPIITATRVMLHCGVETGGPLVAWVSDTNQLLSV